MIKWTQQATFGRKTEKYQSTKNKEMGMFPETVKCLFQMVVRWSEKACHHRAGSDNPLNQENSARCHRYAFIHVQLTKKQSGGEKRKPGKAEVSSLTYHAVEGNKGVCLIMTLFFFKTLFLKHVQSSDSLIFNQDIFITSGTWGGLLPESCENEKVQYPSCLIPRCGSCGRCSPSFTENGTTLFKEIPLCLTDLTG